MPAKINITYEELYQAYVVERKSKLKIADTLGYNEKTVTRALHDYGITIRNGSESILSDPKIFTKLNDRNLLYQSYVTEGKTPPDIAEKLGCSATAVIGHLRAHGIHIRSQSESQLYNPEALIKLNDIRWLSEQYVDMRKTSLEIASAIGCSKPTVLKALRGFGITTRGKSESQIANVAALLKLNDEHWLRNAYLAERKSTHEIAKKIGCSQPVVRRALKKHGIVARNTSESGIANPRALLKLSDYAWFCIEYHTKQRSYKEIADGLGCDGTTVARYRKRHKIPYHSSKNGFNPLKPGYLYEILFDNVETQVIKYGITNSKVVKRISTMGLIDPSYTATILSHIHLDDGYEIARLERVIHKHLENHKFIGGAAIIQNGHTELFTKRIESMTVEYLTSLTCDLQLAA